MNKRQDNVIFRWRTPWRAPWRFVRQRGAFIQRARLGLAFALTYVSWLVLGSVPVMAADEKYRGVPIQPLVGRYLVLKDVNVSAKPKTKSDRAGRLKAGEWVEAFGRPKDTAWIAVKKNGERLGFVFAPMLVPIIEGALKKPLRGRIKVKDKIRCEYAIKFIGKSRVEGEVFKTSDYEVHFDCRQKSKPFKFFAPMFITEGPYQVSRKPHYQISIDLLQVDTKKYDEVFSAIFIYQHNKNNVVFEGLTLKDIGVTPPTKKKQAKSVAAALKGAVEIAASAWGPKVWKALTHNKQPKKK